MQVQILSRIQDILCNFYFILYDPFYEFIIMFIAKRSALRCKGNVFFWNNGLLLHKYLDYYQFIAAIVTFSFQNVCIILLWQNGTYYLTNYLIQHLFKIDNKTSKPTEIQLWCRLSVGLLFPRYTLWAYITWLERWRCTNNFVSLQDYFFRITKWTNKR